MVEKPHFSVVIPIKDEEDNISDLLEELEPVMNSLKKSWELICVDDGSSDSSLSILKEFSKKKPYLRILSFTKNFGQSSAFAAGFEASKGDFIITLDADRQNNPQDIPKLARAIIGYDMAIGWRVERHDPLQKKLISKLSNAVRSRLCRDGIHDTGCSLKIYRKEALGKIKMYKGMHRFLPALFQIEGFKVIEIPVSHRQRTKGKTKYRFFNRFIGPIVDMFVVRWMRKRHVKFQIKEKL